LKRILTLETGRQSVGGLLVIVENGDKHGWEPFGRSIQLEDQFRIDVFEPGWRYATRVYLFADPLNRLGPAEALREIVEYVARLGLTWEKEQVSRLDLKTDVSVPFAEFSHRLNDGLLICRARQNTDLEKKYPTTRYFGTSSKNGKGNGNVLLRIYDKAKEQNITGPWTRVEFQLARDWLRKRWKIEGLRTVPFSELWRYLTNDWFRITGTLPDGKHYDRCPTWEPWKAIQQAEWHEDGFLSRKAARRSTPHPVI
jgi:hypothetical protein